MLICINAQYINSTDTYEKVCNVNIRGLLYVMDVSKHFCCRIICNPFVYFGFAAEKLQDSWFICTSTAGAGPQA